MKRALSLLLCAALLFTAVACGTDSGGNAPQGPSQDGGAALPDGGEGAAAPGSDYKDTIVFSANKDISSLDLQFANDGISWCAIKMLYSNLVRFDANDEVVGDLAKEWTLSEDGMTYTFTLHEGVKFHDGKELTSRDVVATIERAMDSSLGNVVTGIIEMVEGAEAIDDYTVAITTKYPYGPFLQILAIPLMGIMDEEYFNQYGASFGMNVESVNGTGPYRLESWSMDEEMVLVRNEDYFGALPPTPNVVLRPIPDTSARLIALENGEVDIIYGVSSVDLPRLQEMEEFQIISKPSIGITMVQFGCNDPYMSNIKVRQAINYAVDRHEIYEALYQGLSNIATAPMSSSIWGYKNLGIIEQDLDKARALLAEAGYPDGFHTKMVCTTYYDKSVQTAEIMADQLSKIGITMDIEVLEWSTHMAQRSGLGPDEFDFPMFYMGLGTASGDADGMVKGFKTAETNVRNYGFYSNAELDELIVAGQGETDPDKRRAIYDRAAQIVYEEDPVSVYLTETLLVLAADAKLQNPTISMFAYFTFEEATLLR